VNNKKIAIEIKVKENFIILIISWMDLKNKLTPLILKMIKSLLPIICPKFAVKCQIAESSIKNKN
jgi:hypothetical protein